MAHRTRTPPADATPKPASTPGTEPAVPESSPPTYQRKYTRCHKPTCRICADGPGHGPYWYAFWRENGKTKSRYIGKQAPPGADALDSTPAAVPTFRVTTLGGFSVTRAGIALAETAWPRRKALSLFKLLLSVPGRRQTREQALDVLWPDEGPAAASAALRAATHGARHALDLPSGNSLIEARAGVLALADAGTLWVDADAFAASANAALAGHDIEAGRSALAYYGGEYLPDDLYEDWTMQRREELGALRIAVLLHQARLCGEGGDLAEARAALATLLTADPAHEDAAIRQITILAAMGERGEALRVYERLRSALDEQLGLEPSHEVAALASRLRKHRPAPAARPLAAPAAPRRSNLPTALSTFIGREGERETIRRALGTARLVTLTGPGGAGKTRLALRVGESLLEAYPDGVWLCELAGLAPMRQDIDAQSGPNPVTRALAGALGLLEDPECALERTIGTFLEPRHLLLVIDNCEHMLDPVTQLVASLLESCERLTVLATSREALGLPGELVCVVPALSLPSAGQRSTAASLDTYDAILLFVERARARRLGFALDDATAPLVLDICRRLDGIPLAIELAAARLAFLSLADLAARLDNRFTLLVGGSRVALPRQQTLRAAMDWSYSLLGEKERTLLRRLTVFVGGWTPAAAEGICADAELPAELVLDTLGGLVAKSLVTFTED
ncbi:MAG: DUF6788 family protein [Chloroflexota bacterium]